MNILHKVLAEMPSEFTSHAFNKNAKEMGVNEIFIKCDGTKRFLKKYCTHVSRCIWAKVDQKPVQTNWISNVQKSPEDEIEKAITLLKSTNNFKIMRRVSDWNEI
jgi:hypothetical protein